MGTMEPPKKCHITDLLTTNIDSGWDGTEYYVELNDKNIIFRFPWNHKNSHRVDSNKHVLKDLLHKGQFPEDFYTSSVIGFLINTDVLLEKGVLTNEIMENMIRQSNK